MSSEKLKYSNSNYLFDRGGTANCLCEPAALSYICCISLKYLESFFFTMHAVGFHLNNSGITDIQVVC